MNSKTTFWGQVGGIASGLQAVGFAGLGSVTVLAIPLTGIQKEILLWCGFIGFIISGVAKYAGGVATADAEVVQPAKIDPPK